MQFWARNSASLVRSCGARRGQLRSISAVVPGEVLRSRAGRLSLVAQESPGHSSLPLSGLELQESRDVRADGPLAPTFGHLEAAEAPSARPAIDLATFKRYLLVPPLGLRRLFSSEPVKVNENSSVLYKEYVPGSLVAHNYPLALLPRRLSARVDSDVFVRTFSDDERNFRLVGGRKVRLSLAPGLRVQDAYPLLHKVSRGISLLLVFSGDHPNCHYQSVQRWLSDPLLARALAGPPAAPVKVLNAPCNRLLAWAHRRYLEALARTVVPEHRLMAITRRLGVSATLGLHQYRRQLPSVLLVDPAGYIRWHAVGLPSLEALSLLRCSLAELRGQGP